MLLRSVSVPDRVAIRQLKHFFHDTADYQDHKNSGRDTSPGISRVNIIGL